MGVIQSQINQSISMLGFLANQNPAYRLQAEKQKEKQELDFYKKEAQEVYAQNTYDVNNLHGGYDDNIKDYNATKYIRNKASRLTEKALSIDPLDKDLLTMAEKIAQQNSAHAAMMANQQLRNQLKAMGDVKEAKKTPEGKAIVRQMELNKDVIKSISPNWREGGGVKKNG